MAVSAGFLAGKSLGVPLPEIHLTNLGKDDGQEGASSAEIASEVMAAINDEVLGAIGTLDLGSMMEGATELLEGVTGDLGEGAAEAVGDAAEDAADKAKDAIKNIFGN